MGRINYDNKVDRRITTIPDVNKVVAADMNEIKASINALYDLIDTIRIVENIEIDAFDFAGDSYQNSKLVNLVPMVDFNLFSNDGNGSLLKYEDVYLFTPATGTIIATQGNYVLQILNKITT
jgi:hypothetical protein